MKIIPKTRFKKDIQIYNKKLMHRGYCNVYNYELKQYLFNNTWSSTFSRELIIKSNAIGALLYDPTLDKVILIEQLRVPILENNFSPWLVEIVAGNINTNESAEIALVREIKEETNLQILTCIPIIEYFPSPGYSNEKIKLFCARVNATNVSSFSGLINEYEDIKIHVISTADSFTAIDNGEINNAAAIISLQWLKLNLTKIKHMWI